MKNQLLEDLGDANAAAPRMRSRPDGDSRMHEYGVGAASEPAAPSIPPDGRRPTVWRLRQSPAPADSGSPTQPAPSRPEPASHARPDEAAFDLSSFASQQPDPSIQLPDAPIPWTERWGRKLLGWTSIAALVAAVTGGGWWLYGDTQVESTLALVADQAGPVAPPQPEPDSAPVRIPDAPPATTVVQATEPAVFPGTGPEPGPDAAPPTAVSPAAAAATAAVAPIVAKSKPGAAQKRPAASRPRKAAPARAAPLELARNEARRGRETVRSRATGKAAGKPVTAPLPAPVRKTTPVAAPAAAVEDEYPLAETLRQCRAAGYHATMCIQRGCTATKFGLACRG